MSRRAAFLDRDGVIVSLVPDERTGTLESPYQPADVALEPGAAQGLRALRDAGYVLCVVSNQPSAAKGFTTVAQLDAVEERARAMLHSEGVRLDEWRRCLHHPAGVIEELAGDCRCRKPEPGLLLDAAAQLGLDLGESWMVGDADSDVAAGRAAGCRTILVESPGSSHRRSGAASPDGLSRNLSEAVTFILRAPSLR